MLSAPANVAANTGAATGDAAGQGAAAGGAGKHEESSSSTRHKHIRNSYLLPKHPSMTRKLPNIPMSKMNSEHLHLLKNIRTSEISQVVKGTNAAMHTKTQRKVDKWFTDHQWTVAKIDKKQAKYYEQLCQIHLERRQLMREMLFYRQEESRAIALRERAHFETREKLERINRQIVEYKENLESMVRANRSSRLSHAHSKSQPRRNNNLVGGSPEVPVIVNAPHEDVMQPVVVDVTVLECASTGRSDAAAVHDRDQHEAEEAPDPTASQNSAAADTHANTMQVARAVEVKKNSDTPVTRTLSNLSNTKKSTMEKFLGDVVSAEHGDGQDAAVNTVATANADQQQLESDRNNQRLDAVVLLDQTHDQMPQHDGDEQSHQQHDCQKAAAPSPTKSQVEKNRERRKLQLEKERRIIDEPYDVYRKDNVTGEISPISYQLLAGDVGNAGVGVGGGGGGDMQKPEKFAEPTNKETYRRDKMLEQERRNFAAHLMQLNATTNELIENDRKINAQFLTSVSEAKNLARQLAAERRQSRIDNALRAKVGPAEWMRVFVPTKLPDGIDPKSIEGIPYCRWVRIAQSKFNELDFARAHHLEHVSGPHGKKDSDATNANASTNASRNPTNVSKAALSSRRTLLQQQRQPSISGGAADGAAGGVAGGGGGNAGSTLVKQSTLPSDSAGWAAAAALGGIGTSSAAGTLPPISSSGTARNNPLK